MGLHLPEAPPPDSDEEDDPEGAAAQRSRASIPMDAGEEAPVTALHLPSLRIKLTLPVCCRSHRAGEEDDGGRGVAVARRAAVGSGHLR